MANTDNVFGMVWVRKSTTLATSNSKRLSTSPEWKCSLPCHCERRMRSSIRCCIRFRARMPRRFCTHVPLILSRKSQRINIPMTATAQYRLPPAAPLATSMAWRTAVTWARDTTTDNKPMTPFKHACKRLPRQARQSQRKMSMALYLEPRDLKALLKILDMTTLHQQLSTLVSAPHELFSQ